MGRPTTTSKDIGDYPAFPLLKSRLPISDDGNLNIDDWLKIGLIKGGIIPTGLESVENVDLKSAVEKLYKTRDSIISKKFFPAQN